jgi:hypothetical protein
MAPQVVEPDLAHAGPLQRGFEPFEQPRAIERSAAVRVREHEVIVGLVARRLKQF